MKSQPVDHVLLQKTFSLGSLRSLVEGYILNCRCESKSTATIASYQYRLSSFMWFCQAKGYPDEPEKLTSYAIRQFLWYLASEKNRWGGRSISAREPASAATVNLYYRVLNSFFNWLKQEDLISENPMDKIKTPKFEKKVIQALTPKEVKALLDQCSAKSTLSVRNRAILMMLLDTGLRVSELVNLKLDDVDMKTGSVMVVNGKGGKQRIVRIGIKAQKTLWRYITIWRRGGNEMLFLNRCGDPLDIRGVTLMVRRIGQKARVNSVHVHRLRHTFAISFLRAGGDVFSLQYLLGHSTLQMTQRYLQSLNADDAMNAHRRFSPMDNLKV
ncbi:tyrosine-type recombinase/integrase [Chloroflexota bacterium]